MPSLGASTVVIQDRKVLLIKREDFEVWALPGGAVEPRETTAQAAIREVREETAIDVELSRLVGIYSSPQWHDGGDHVIQYAGRALNDDLVKQTGETIDAGYFDVENLPETLVWWHEKRIADAVNGLTGVSCLQDRVWPLGDMSRKDLYKAVADSGMTKSEFYTEHFSARRNELDEVKSSRLQEPNIGGDV